MDTPISNDYRAHIQQHILELSPILAKAAAGDFSQNVPLTEREDEFTVIYVGVQLLLDVIREKVARLEDTNFQLQERIEEKQALLQSISDGVVVLDREGIVTFMNLAASKLLGFDQSEVVGHKWVDVVSLERSDKSVVPSSERPLTVDVQMRSENVIETATYYYVRKDKSRFPVRSIVTPVQVSNQSVGNIIMFHDVTKEKAVGKLKEDFLSLATHQLRSPLTTMTWTLDTLLQDTANISPEVHNKIENVYRSAQNLIELVNDILSVTRINQDILEEQKSPINVGQLLKNIIEQAQTEATKRQVSLELQIANPAVTEKEYSLDTTLFQQCIQNLVTNAIRYSKPAGTVQVIASIGDRQLVLEVKDQGIGIPDKDQPHVFEKFYRGGNIAIDTTPGSGLGLFIVRSLVERWGGSISFTSHENQGSSFVIHLPLQT